MPGPSQELLTDLLQSVSRSFYWTLRVLPGAIRPQISSAYLIARMTDTIADSEVVPPAHRIEALQSFRERIFGTRQQPLNFSGLAKHQGRPVERILLERCEEAVSLFNRFSNSDQQFIREVLEIITSGQELDLKRFERARPENIVALQTRQELDEYTYRVAGCVGEFWTKICRAHLFPNAALDDAQLIRNGIRFGKGLQLVNILRDLPADLRQGRCYIPLETLAACKLAPADLLNPASEQQFRPFYCQFLDQAKDHLAAGWAYTNALPRSCMRVRLACAWPILIGVRTLGKLRAGNVLDARQRIKITRAEVRTIILHSVLFYPLPAVWRNLFQAQANKA